jgi:hypothetical protein
LVEEIDTTRSSCKGQSTGNTAVVRIGTRLALNGIDGAGSLLMIRRDFKQWRIYIRYLLRQPEVVEDQIQEGKGTLFRQQSQRQ